MNDFSNTLSDSFSRLRRWCDENRHLALAAGIGIISVLTLIIVLICGPKTVDRAEDPVHGITWTFRSDGTLIFEGDGEVTGLELIFTEEGESSQTAKEPAWYAYRDEVVSIETGRHITHIGADCFVGFTSLETLTVRGKTTEIDIECFRCETEAERQCFAQLIVFAPEVSPARDYAEFNGLTYRPL